VRAAPDLRGQLIGLRDACREWHGLGVDTFHPVAVRPSLGFALVPRPRTKEDRDPEAPRPVFGPRPIYGDTGRLCALMAAGAAARRRAGLGSSEGSESDASEQQGRRRGLHGLTRYGAGVIEDLCQLTRQDHFCYGFWTVTLPHEVAQALDRQEHGWQRFADTIRRRFAEALKRAAAAESLRRRFPVPAHWWFVAEPQKSGRPHLHFVFRCKARRGTGWLLGKGRLDRLIRNAFRSVTGEAYPVTAAGNVQAIRRSAGAYLSKYLRKGGEANGADAVRRGGWSLNLVPHQWWGCSRCALAFLREHTWTLPNIAANWLSREWPALAAAGVIDARLWQPEDEGAPAIVCGRWRSIERLCGVLDHLFSLTEDPYPQ
jgi:hypothetical protein